MLLRLSLTALLLIVLACSRQRTSVAVDAALLTQVPGDTIAVGALRVKALRETAAWKKLLAQPGVDRQLAQLAEETSFDVRKDLWEVLWSTNGKDPLVYARGEFAPLGLEPRIEREGVQRLNYKGSMLLGNAEKAVWFVNSSTAVFGATAKLHELIDSRDSGKVGPSQAIRQRIDKLPPNVHIWLVADASSLPQPTETVAKGGAFMNLMQNMPKLLQSVEMITAQASLTDGLAMEAIAYCANEAGAKQVHDALKGIVGLARFGLPEKQRTAFMPLLDSVDVSQAQTQATLRARLTVEQFENLQAAVQPPAKATE